MTVTMQQGRTIASLFIQPESLVVGATTEYVIKFASETPIVNGDKIIITFPDGIVPVTGQDCFGAEALNYN